jgi:hypothetical protein
LFIEWETLYYHIDRSKWKVAVRPSPVGHKHLQVRYGVDGLLYDDKEEDPTKGNQADKRFLSGRILILPQPVFSLEAIVNQVLDNPGPDMPIKDPTEIKKIKTNIRKLQFISAPLSGMTEHLLTRYEGTHVKPNLRYQGQQVKPLQAAITQAQQLPGFNTFNEEAMEMIDSER